MSFLGLHTALTGIRAGQFGLDTASHNVANANTPGYTRQRVDLASRIPYRSTAGPIGTGVDVVGVARLRDVFLDTRVRTTGESFAAADTTAALLQRAEDVLGEPSNGVTVLLGELFDSFDDLAISPADPAARAQVVSNVTALTARFNAVDFGWGQLSADAESRLQLSITDVNGKLDRLTEINRTARSFGDDQIPGDLLDERDLVLDQLATAVGTRSFVRPDGMVEVRIDGNLVVDGGPPPSNEALEYVGAGTSGVVRIVGGSAVDAGGEIGAVHDFTTTGLPTLRADFDALAVSVRDTINAQHANGSYFDGTAWQPGGDVFDGTGAGDLSLAAGFTGRHLAAAGAVDPDVHDGRGAAALAALREGVLDDGARVFAVSLGQQVANATAAADARESLYVGATVSRQSAHSVSLDEEMVSLVQFQRALEASSRVMTAVDQALDVLVNRTGVVGR